MEKATKAEQVDMDTESVQEVVAEEAAASFVKYSGLVGRGQLRMRPLVAAAPFAKRSSP